VSLGKAEKLYGGHPDTSAADTDVIGMHGVWNTSGLKLAYANKGETALGDTWIGARNHIEGASSYTPSRELPKEPFPRDVSLEKSSKTQVELYYDLKYDHYDPLTASNALPFGVSSGWNDASNIITPNGHNLNSLYSVAESKSMETLFQGCYAPSDGMDVYLWKKHLTREVVELSPSPLSNMVGGFYASAGDVSGRYNTVGSMDKEGYLVAYPIQNHPASGDTTQGVGVSAATTSSLASVSYTGGGLVDGSAAFIGSPAVCYNFTISSTDLLCLAAYKGVTNIGLWALDAKETFKSEAAPVAWTTPTNNRKYKLFAKKVFSEDLTTIQDVGTGGNDGGIINYVDLTIQWRINFDFGRTF
jgi:hypothetical protein